MTSYLYSSGFNSCLDQTGRQIDIRLKVLPQYDHVTNVTISFYIYLLFLLRTEIMNNIFKESGHQI